MNINIKALIVRAVKTFLQAFLAAVLAGLSVAVSIPTVKALLVGAIAAGVSAVMNVFLKPVEAK